MITVFDVANALLVMDRLNNEMPSLKLHVLIYYAQGFHLAMYNKPLFSESIELRGGYPISPELNKRLSLIDFPEVHNETTPESLTPRQLECIEGVYDAFAQYATWKLLEMVSVESVWLDHRLASKVIPCEVIKDIFIQRFRF